MATRANNPSTTLIVLTLASIGWALGVAVISLLLLGVADTWHGRLFGFAALLAAVTPLAAVYAWRSNSRKTTALAAGVFAAWLLAVVALALKAPTGQTAPSGRLSNRYSPQAGSFSRFAPGNWLPESDQLLLAFTIASIVDPLLTSAKAAELKRLTVSLYRELEADADFKAVGSAMSDTYADLLGRSGVSGHSYVYVPAGVDRTKPRPVLVFFHGSGGNFKAYVWVLSKLADRLGFVLVAPTNGFGNWREAESNLCLGGALDAAAQVAAINRDHVHIMGLSNGGLAVSQLAASSKRPVESLIFLSPVFDAGKIPSTAFARENRDRRILVVTGAQDERIPLDYVEENAGRMTKAGARVRLQVFDNADHFLIFSHRQQLVDLLADWFGPAPAGP